MQLYSSKSNHVKVELKASATSWFQNLFGSGQFWQHRGTVRDQAVSLRNVRFKVCYFKHEGLKAQDSLPKVTGVTTTV